MIKQPIVLTIMRPIVVFLLVPCLVPSPRLVYLIRSSHPSIPSCVRSSRPVPAVPPFCRFACPRRLPSSRFSPRCPDKQGGALSPYSVSPSPTCNLGSSDVVRCRDVPWDVARCGIR